MRCSQNKATFPLKSALNDGSQWVNYYKRTYPYNSNEDMTLAFSKRWNLSLWTSLDESLSFKDSFGRTYTYHASEINDYFRTITDVDEENYSVSKYVLLQNYPNPLIQ